MNFSPERTCLSVITLYYLSVLQKHCVSSKCLENTYLQRKCSQVQKRKGEYPPTQGKTWKPYFCPFFFDLHFFKRRPGAVESSNAECKYLHLCKISHCFWSLVITRHLFIAILTWWISYI